MKRNFGREILLLCLPIVLLGSVAWWKIHTGYNSSRDSSFGLSNKGPLRLEYSPFEQIEVQPADAAQGYNWAAASRTWTQGADGVPATFKCVSEGWGVASNTRLIYRRGERWSQVKGLFLSFGVGPKVTLGLKLEGVPHDAEEIRLRGAFSLSRYYKGKWPPSLKPPKNLKIYPTRFAIGLTSKPFDILVKDTRANVRSK